MSETMAKQRPYAHYAICALIGLCGAAAGFVICAFFAYHIIGIDFLSGSNCTDLSQFRLCFISQKWDDSTYLSIITSFYGTLITTITGLLAVVAALAFLVIKSSARHHAQEAMVTEIAVYLESESGTNKINNEIANHVTRLSNLKFGDLESQVETIIAVMEENGFEFPGRIGEQDETQT